ncbi:hypothetical protein B296_00044555 [Ensete ventricosum]|uniref:Uncharacterized protein n=1 Tax=Ensete ventricosum TaxID=4639 RepID=A0A426YHD3_ENSVE|nr:hypothetical protein B296_00044555 [Ensete ventricosum]
MREAEWNKEIRGAEGASGATILVVRATVLATTVAEGIARGCDAAASCRGGKAQLEWEAMAVMQQGRTLATGATLMVRAVGDRGRMLSESRGGRGEKEADNATEKAVRAERRD